MENIKRNFIDMLQNHLKEEQPLIQILLGPRQVGKTTGVLQLVKTYTGPWHYCSADAVMQATDHWILEQWQEALLKGTHTLLIIDEIQNIPNWSDTIKKLWDEQSLKKTALKLILLGSSSLSLSKGISESLAGRFEMIPVFHWDFHESAKLRPMDLSAYLSYGGYPKSYEYMDEYDRWFSYIKNSIIDRVIEKDILQFAIIKNPALFRQAFEIICCYPAQEISYRKLLGQLQDKGNTDLIKYYISLFEGAFLIKALPKYGSQEFKIKSSSPKILPLAPCFYHIFSRNDDRKNFVFEATVGAKLLQLSSALYYWRQGNDEVDFILVWRRKLFAVEVKSGRKKRADGLTKFLSLHADAVPVIISRDNYSQFIENPKRFLEKLF